MWLWWMRTRVSSSERILVSSSVTEGAWGPGWGWGAPFGSPSSSASPCCLLSQRLCSLLRFLPYAFILFPALELGLGGDSHIQSLERLLLPDRNQAV